MSGLAGRGGRSGWRHRRGRHDRRRGARRGGPAVRARRDWRRRHDAGRDAAALLQLCHPLDERARGVVELRELDAHPRRAARVGGRVLRLNPADDALAADRRLAAGEPELEEEPRADGPGIAGADEHAAARDVHREALHELVDGAIGEPHGETHRRPRAAALVVWPLHCARLSLRGGRTGKRALSSMRPRSHVGVERRRRSPGGRSPGKSGGGTGALTGSSALDYTSACSTATTSASR